MSEIHTRPEIAAGLRGLGVAPGDLLLVHTSVKALGWIPGGAVAVVQALRDAVGDTGTIVVPTQTAGNSDPSAWQHPPVPAEWWPVIREHTPAFDPAVTPSEWMGKVPEVVRTWPGARVLVLGADFGSCTAFHLAEYRVPGAATTKTDGAAVRTEDGGRTWATYQDLDLDEDDFEQIGDAMLATGSVRTGRVGAADCHLVDLPTAVAFAAGWMHEHRGRATGSPG
jgi:aminoglycoside 3-N-acetyltransferase